MNPSDVFSYESKTGIMKLGKEAMTEQEIKSLQEEVKFIESTLWWKIVNETLQQKAQEVAFQNSTMFEDMRTAKAMMRNMRLIRELNAVVKSWKTPKERTKGIYKPID